MRPLVERWGEDRVWSAGLEVLGYPPIWNDVLENDSLPVFEAARIAKYLKGA